MCKVSQKALAKNKVQDIGDTIDFHNANGYFLITSAPDITTTLRNALVKRKDIGQFIDWWTRVEIEEKLDEHPAIHSHFKDIVQMEFE